ncbi:MAG: DNA polymerase I [Ruminococcus sp.]|nr:DNA polymerase I [Ruminococcus sp.]
MKLLVIDGNSMIHRAYYGVRALSNHAGIATNAIFGFMNMYLKEIGAVKPDAVAVAFDLDVPTFRHEKNAEYKANRKGMPEELAMQMPYVKQILTNLGIACVSAEKFEADDILGTLANACDKQNQECILMTGDRDSLQLITKNTTVHLVKNQEMICYTPEKFQEEYGFAPEYLIDLKALMGDSSDNIKGVKGIGEKTAKNLIQAWNSIENLYANLETISATPRIKKLLTEGKANAEESKFLATIVKNAPVSVNLQDYIPKKQDSENLRKILTELELNRLLERLHLQPLISTDTQDIIITKKQMPEFIFSDKIIKKSDKPVSYIFSGQELVICQDNLIMKTQDKTEILDFLESDIEKITDNAKPHYRYAFANHRKLNNLIFDASICGYVLNPSETDYSISALCKNLNISYFEELKNLAPVQALAEIYRKGIQQLEQDNLLKLWREIELPLIRVLASMEHVGVLVDTKGIQEFGNMLAGLIAETKQKIYDIAGEEFNIASPKQLGVILFEKLNLPVVKKTKTGYATNAEVLEELLEKTGHEIINYILEYRKYTKLQSTYVDGLLSKMEPDGRIHTNYKQTETRTGRISSTEPNLQNIPIRTELGRQMRKFFKASENHILLDADYSQIELRLMADLSQDKAMQQAFLSGFDIHTATASKIFNVPELSVTSEMRSTVKAINFGILYGMGAYSLSKDIHVSKQEAENYIQEYLGSYPKVSEFLDNMIKNATKNGYVSTMFGRRRYIPDLTSKNKQVQAGAKRIAMNTPVQGSSADIIKLAMIRVHDRLEKEVPSAKLLLQVHDELIIEVPESDADSAQKILQEEMTNAVDLSVPLIAEVKKGKTWYDAKD